ncbi:hypothetical protein P3G55_04700 [Leptospira sp. 96542]|nr:hypothetical protein [Leptospira sp. 96542]
MRFFWIFVLCFYFIQCTGIQKKSDYNQSIQNWNDADSESASKNLPKKEENGFIRILEKSHIDFFNGNNKFNDLETLADKTKNRLRFSASRTLKSFFYLETEEGYYASEAEIIYMHILLGLYQARVGNFEKAKIEARYAGNLLSGEWSAEGQFDDPTLRMLLGALWTVCGDWEEAKIDFRRAHQLKPNSNVYRNLANMPPPKGELVLVLGGPGAEPKMNPAVNLNFIRGLRNLEFKTKGERSQIYISNENTKENLQWEGDTMNWYSRHLVRDNEIAELVEDSKYFQRMTTTAIKEGSIGTAKVGLGILTGTAIVAVGAGLVYIGAQSSGGGEIAAWGIITIGFGIKTGADMVENAYKETKKNVEEDLDISGNYRYARFLPEYIWITTTKESLKKPILKSKSDKKHILLEPIGKIPVRFGFVPDVESKPQNP